MVRKFLTGDKELEAALKSLADKAADKIAKSALGGGLTVLAKGIRKAAPAGATGILKKSIGKRLEKRKRGNTFTAKTGVNVGKTTKKEKLSGSNRAPHSHLVALGTKPRIRKTIGGKFGYIRKPTVEQLSTGTMPANPFVRLGAASAMSQVPAAMKKRAIKALERAVKKARKK